METLYLLKYNNYYNRIVKREETLTAYLDYTVKYNDTNVDANGNTAVIENVNFVDGDYVDTTQVVNWGGDLPDYLVVTRNSVIISRWFVVNLQKNRGGQLILTLHRDLVVDHYSNLLSNETAIFVEKAIIPSINDLIFNSENMSFNQIKTKETLLKDDTKCPWIVIYGARNTSEGNETTFTSTFKTNYPAIEITPEQYNALVSHANTPIKKLNRALISLSSYSATPLTFTPFIQISSLSGPVQTNAPSSADGSALREDALDILNAPSGVNDSLWDRAVGNVAFILPDYVPELNQDLYNQISAAQGKYLKYISPAGTKYFQINITTIGTDSVATFLTKESDYAGRMTEYLNLLRPCFTSFFGATIGYTSSGSYRNMVVGYYADTIKFTVDEIPAPTTQGDGDTVEIEAARYHLTDAPYDMFCLPLSSDLIIKNSLRTAFTQVKSNIFLNLSVANQLMADYGGVGQIYDVQILPYCPIGTHLITTDTEGNLVYDINDSSSYSFSIIRASGSNVPIGYVLHASQSSFSLNIDLEEPITISDYKVESECDLYRLNSPNYGAIFEFNAAKNGGLTTFNVKCTYKPFNPYIKLYPNWGRLYGNDFNDARGLICNGDFSLPALTDQWKTYELTNKNYQASFDRQIQNLEINNAVQREREIWGAAAGALSGGMSGAVTGGVIGGPIGAAIGGALGVGASVAGGVRDVQLSDKLRKEAIDYTRDQFGYQLGNIKALPQTLSRTSAYNVDNKYFPFLEYYTCSEVEKQALRDKIKFNGMTVMAIGTMKYYKDNYQGTDPMYFKGKLIRLDGFDGDYHLLNAIADELDKGVFIK